MSFVRAQVASRINFVIEAERQQRTFLCVICLNKILISGEAAAEKACGID